MIKELFSTTIAVLIFMLGHSQLPDGVLIRESFDKKDLQSRGWYDGGKFRMSDKTFKGNGSIEYEWVEGKQPVQGSSGWRHLFEPSDEVYVRYYLRLSDGWEWTGVDYHPHLTHFMTTENSEYHGPARSHLTLYIEPVNGKLRLGATDMQNVDMPHGVTQGELKGGYNGKLYDSKEILFDDNKWHCVEAYFKLNSVDIQNDQANKDGIVRGWFDGNLVVNKTDVILRSPDFPKMEFNQFLITPYFGPGLLNNDQKLWIDELVVGNKRIGCL